MVLLPPLQHRVGQQSLARRRVPALLVFPNLHRNISRHGKLGAALEPPGAGVWVVLTQGAGTPATTTNGRRFAASFTFHYDNIATQIDITSIPGI